MITSLVNQQPLPNIRTPQHNLDFKGAEVAEEGCGGRKRVWCGAEGVAREGDDTRIMGGVDSKMWQGEM